MKSRVNLSFRQAVFQLKRNEIALLKKIEKTTDDNSLNVLYAMLEANKKAIQALTFENIVMGFIGLAGIVVIFGSLVKIAAIIY
ncbi:hypothetical protein [Clostridium intestinale]|uniref:Uncharacterized protein n=1 Tax=Clostridium intestinale TaxID=36845 RepID=A0A7D6VNB0_9CLOT|nr:hypothetical protein [Clostridium intestinale]QLY77828.1 hypothetical protein HZF06_11970 [Clostridium intestinale]